MKRMLTVGQVVETAQLVRHGMHVACINSNHKLMVEARKNDQASRHDSSQCKAAGPAHASYGKKLGSPREAELKAMPARNCA